MFQLSIEFTLIIFGDPLLALSVGLLEFGSIVGEERVEFGVLVETHLHQVLCLGDVYGTHLKIL